MSLIQQSTEGDIGGETTDREVENVLELRGEREGHARRDSGVERRGYVEGLILKGDSEGGRGLSSDERGQSHIDTINWIGGGDLRAERKEGERE